MARKSVFLNALLALVLILTQFPQSSNAASIDPGVDISPPGDDEGPRIFNHGGTGQVRFLGAPKDSPIHPSISNPKSASTVQVARALVAEYGDLFGLDDDPNSLGVMRTNKGNNNRSGIRFQQYFKGIPVFGGELIVQLDSDHNLLSMSGEILPNLTERPSPSLSSKQAEDLSIALVAEQYGYEESFLSSTKPKLWLYNPVLAGGSGNTTSLVWLSEITTVEVAPVNHLILINALDGSVVLNINQVDQILNRETYTYSGTPDTPTLVCNESDPTCAAGDNDAKKAHEYAGDAYDFYFTNHGRDSIDDAGMTLKSNVHVDLGECNAFWWIDQMWYADSCFLISDDVVGHELTHGVTTRESNLVYANQSGAINESFSDIWGEFIDQGNGSGDDSAPVKWLMGEDTSIGALRDMADPPSMYDPDRMGSPLYYKGSSDNGGVHTNSGVGNKTAYLITDGGSFNGYTVTGLGITKTATIYYEAQINLLTTFSDYADLGAALYQACLNSIGVNGIVLADCAEVTEATLATEILAVDAPTAKSPKNAIDDKTPKYKWSKVSGATQYQFELWQGTNRIYEYTVSSSVCGSSTCKKTPSQSLSTNSTYTWRVRAKVGGVWGSWSASREFTVVKSGFNSSFNKNKKGWTKVSGTWKLKKGKYYQSNGNSNRWASIVHDNNYTIQTYQVKMKRTGENSWANAILVRGEPNPLDSDKSWNDAMYLAYRNDGKAQIGFWRDTLFYSLTGWFNTPSINKGGWNTLKVTAYGDYFQFYINGSFLAYGHISGFSSGKVGVGFYRDGTAGKLKVDWAKLSLTAPSTEPINQGINLGVIDGSQFIGKPGALPEGLAPEILPNELDSDDQTLTKEVVPTQTPEPVITEQGTKEETATPSPTEEATEADTPEPSPTEEATMADTPEPSPTEEPTLTDTPIPDSE